MAREKPFYDDHTTTRAPHAAFRVRPDHHDRRRRADVRCPRVADRVGDPALLAAGVACVWIGDADAGRRSRRLGARRPDVVLRNLVAADDAARVAFPLVAALLAAPPRAR